MIPAQHSMPGVRYLSKTNLPVEVQEIKQSYVLLRCLFGNENVVKVDIDYPLKTYTPAMDREIQEASTYRTKENNMDAETKTKKRGGLSALMDPLFFEGGHTVQEIANIVAEKDPTAKEGRNLVGNVRVRMAVLKKRGYQILLDEQKKVKLVK